MKKTVYKKLGISIIASTLLASQLSTVSALSVISSTGEEYEVSETLQDSPGTNNFSLPNVSPTYGQYYTNQSEVIIGKNDLVKVKNTLQYPYSTSAYVESEFRGVKNGKDVTYRGSANFIKDNVLITAAHNIYKHEFGKDAEELYVTPARTPNSVPFGRIKVKEVRYLKEFRNLNSKDAREYDLALLILEEPIGAKLGTLGLPTSQKNLTGITVTITGYPSYNFKIHQMYTDKKQVLSDDGMFLDYQVDTLEGSSGSTVYDASHRVVGVHTLGDGANQINSAVKLNERNLPFIYSVLKGYSLEGWKKINGSWYYYRQHDKQTGWQEINDTWYYLDSSGKMLTDWQKVNGNWYYLNSNGAMVTGSQTIDGKVYNFASSGEWI
ncbi:V8-like Glu-specific endopeptidase [Streptococcus pneumoniae]|nr:V8-like Glu-specific endopeptidase [Streptococcus pneumoniae]CVK78319.1 V8-like Glu-specific endopeptidase [Streptococcus pneumoniae]CVW01025.1 V8-like Glu-specific endopeptidase [Streptococcus pneumoniae]CVY78683.1 V8-like Glu-specific endopeptidase [Streptococcus pneumoniae]CVZ07108.1 V8-like Glu-specific endopeptidase [Streptococcus pneumoniae]